ncbi:RHS repeat-associated core domain-containing protein [Clostridium sp. 19966]|uniref:RHS repeat-associated core domain-containing protein n=1 Tax=Clostridium sp. 19966 TaxID=2768166 RepID=UPI0028E5DE79|nr:RHS repeat-associated core domain-containing protein [Clostridium sp. 19966]
MVNKSITYSYDAGGNIQTKTEYAYTTGSLGTATATHSYTYGNSNWKDELTAYDGKAITYDAIGNPLTYAGYSYSWEQGRQLSGITGNGLTASYKYDDSGIRTQKTVNGVTTNYHLVGSDVTYEDNGTDKIYYTYDSHGSLVSMNLNGVEYYYIRNGQSDIIGLFDKTGAQVVSYTYDTWGKLVSIDGSLKDSVGVKNPYRYRGYRYDTETGLYYLQSRYYNPDWGRFINADAIAGSVGELLGHNLFDYCKNNPASGKDPDGFRMVGSEPDECAGSGSGIAVSAAATGAYSGPSQNDYKSGSGDTVVGKIIHTNVPLTTTWTQWNEKAKSNGVSHSTRRQVLRSEFNSQKTVPVPINGMRGPLASYGSRIGIITTIVYLQSLHKNYSDYKNSGMVTVYTADGIDTISIFGGAAAIAFIPEETPILIAGGLAIGTSWAVGSIAGEIKKLIFGK